MPAGLYPPEEVYVRWESIVEQKVYEAKVTVPQSIRKIMREPVPVCVNKNSDLYEAYKNVTAYYNKFTVGVAPGGIVTLWVGAVCQPDIVPPIMILRAEGWIFPGGPKFYDGKSHGYTTPSAEARECIKKHGGIPYGSW